MRISDWSSDVCSSDLAVHDVAHRHPNRLAGEHADDESPVVAPDEGESDGADHARQARHELEDELLVEGKILSEGDGADVVEALQQWCEGRSEEHTSELQSLMRISYAVFCLKKKKKVDYSKQQQTRPRRQTLNTSRN